MSSIETISQKQNLLNKRESLLQQFNKLPINNPEVLVSLFKPDSSDTRHEKMLKDLLAYHQMTLIVSQISSIEEKLAAQEGTKRQTTDSSTLRRSMEQTLKQIGFKAIQFTIGLISKEISVLLQLPIANLITVLRPLRDIPEIRPILLSQYEAHQRLKIRDVLAEFQIGIQKDQIEVYFEMTLEALLRFCKFDLTLFLGSRYLIKACLRKHSQRMWPI